MTLHTFTSSLALFGCLAQAVVFFPEPARFGSSAASCPAPLWNDCMDLVVDLQNTVDGRGANDSIRIVEGEFTQVANQGACSLAAFWERSNSRGGITVTRSGAALAALALIGFGDDDGVPAGVVGNSLLNRGSDGQLWWYIGPGYASDDEWRAGFDQCRGATEANLIEQQDHIESTPSGALDLQEYEIVKAAQAILSTVGVGILTGRDNLPLEARDELTKLSLMTDEELDRWIVKRQTVPYVASCEFFRFRGDVAEYRCNCNGASYNVWCGRDETPTSGWSEETRKNTIARFATDMLRESLVPGTAYYSGKSNAGAMLYTGPIGKTDPIHVPSEDNIDCCAALLFQQCRIIPNRVTRVSNEGHCEPSFTELWMMAYNQRLFQEAKGSCVRPGGCDEL